MQYTYELFLKELGARLKQMRKERGWTLRTMVVEHKFHATHWQSFESGKAISVPSLLRACEAFDVPLEDLVRGLGRFGTPETQSDQESSVTAPTPAKRSDRSKQTARGKKRD
ncbi:helix-turn-helix domain-containing protein [Granulicella sibirica]|uniref:helix-turn-helix domain-containing protein n=1 Tax=Granulicella sibirica TaxID=2479048 RepID=UPI0010090E30|nr:helix-turn-helix transcriptional regulator [Granulicella sibirica]